MTPTDAAIAQAWAELFGSPGSDPLFDRFMRRARELDAEKGDEDCFCDRTGLGVRGVSCGDCPRDYIPTPPAQAAEAVLATVANAIAREDSGYSADELNADTRRRYYIQARAAIAAMRAGDE